jgi:hypothetical protein
MAPEFTPEEPEQERDQRAAGQEQFYEEIRTEGAELFHASTVGRAHSAGVSGLALPVTTETP